MLLETYKNPDFSHQYVENRRKKTDVHFHSDHELYYLVKGTTKYFIGDKIFQLESGNFVIIPAGLHHKADSENCLINERILVSFKSDTFSDETLKILDNFFSESVIYIPNSRLEAIEDIFSKIDNEYKSKDEYSSVLINSYIEEIIILLARFRQDYRPNLPDADKTIHKISKYIKDNYSQNLTLESISRTFSLSTAHLSRRFKVVCGIGINEYITYVRLLNAEHLLKETDLPITEIAGKCGFNDSNYFSTVFKKAKGTTPLKFSREAKKGL